MNKTAVEWLIERINDPKGFNAFIIDNLIETAKAMEKEQMFKALVKGTNVYSAYDIELEFNEYYNETFKSE